ncbi:MAG: LegC family aminotransferase [Syntrophomonadaceae bacterium]|jgi:perosamine synthetase|nr:LegC family aminotransferase [Syntrophomonadaceae bacterium]
MSQAEIIISKIRQVLGDERSRIALHEPCFAGREWEYVRDCLDTGWVSSAGQYVERFEKGLVDFTGVKYAVAVVNGTAALHTALKLVGVEAEDEVLIPALTFIATANAVAYCGAVPHLIDSEPRALGMDPYKLEAYLKDVAVIDKGVCINRLTSRRIKAVVPMHTFGHPVDLDPLLELCQKYHLEMVEDAAESVGSYYKGKHTGGFGKAGILSFNGNKIVTTGGGGAILTNDPELAKLAKHITTTAKQPHPWAFYHDMTGFNYRLPNLNAALGCAQLEQLPGFIDRKRALAQRYQEAFADVPGVTVFKEADFARSNYWLNALLLDEQYAAEREAVLELSNAQGIMTRPAWILMNKLPMYKNCPHMDLSAAQNMERRIINIPSSVFL